MTEAESEAIFQELAEHSWERFHDSYYNDRVDDVLLGALIASLVGSGYSLIGLNSDGENHHLRLQRQDESTRLILRLTHLSSDLTDRHASVIIGYGERTPNLSQVWGRFQSEVKSLYSPAWEPGIISFDADLAAQFLYAQISLLMDLDRYVGEDFQVNLKLFGSHVEALVACLRRYLRGRLDKPADQGPATLPPTLAQDRELQESRHEVLMGEIIYTMAEAGYPVIGVVTDVGCRRIRFRAKPDPVLNAVLIELQPDRFPIHPYRAGLVVQGEIKNYLANTGELLKLNEQLRQLPVRPELALSYRMNSVFARSDQVFSSPLEAGAPEWRASLSQLLMGTIEQLREALSPYKKSFSPFSQKIVRARKATESPAEG